jgi:PEP-CTERM motif
MSKFKQSAIAISAALALGLFCASASADVVIDLFSEPSVGVDEVVDTNASSGSSASLESPSDPAAPYANVLGGYRDLYINKTFDNGDGGGRARLAVGNSRLSYSNEAGIKSVGAVTWDGKDNDGDIDAVSYSELLLNASSLTGFTATVLAVDLGFDYAIQVWDTAGNTSKLTSSVLFQVLSSASTQAQKDACNATPITCQIGPVSAYYDFSWFNLPEGDQSAGGLDFSIESNGIVDFSKIGALQLQLLDTGSADVDLTLDSVNAVPEPGVLSLVGLGLLGAAVAGRRRKAVRG